MKCAELLFEPNNLLPFVHQVIKEFRFLKPLAQKRFKPNLEFRYQIIVSSIKLKKRFAKLMIPIALFKKIWVNHLLRVLKSVT